MKFSFLHCGTIVIQSAQQHRKMSVPSVSLQCITSVTSLVACKCSWYTIMYTSLALHPYHSKNLQESIHNLPYTQAHHSIPYGLAYHHHACYIYMLHPACSTKHSALCTSAGCMLHGSATPRRQHVLHNNICIYITLQLGRDRDNAIR
jgi:hypothetical protein